MKKDSVILVAGASGVAGSAIVRRLQKDGYSSILTPGHHEMDMGSMEQVQTYFKAEHPEYVFLTAAKVGSIAYRNAHPVELLLENLQIQNNIISAAYKFGAKKLLFMSSDFIYPNTDTGILHEEDFLTAAPGPKDLPYSLAKTVGVKLCDYYRQEYGREFFTVVPCAFFGIGSSYDIERANVVMALIRRMHDAKIAGEMQFKIWGTGKPVKEFLYSDDVASACIFLMKKELDSGLYNIGAGNGGTSIWELAHIIRDVVDYTGEIVCDPSKPDGIMRRVPDSTRITDMGWRPSVTLKDGLERTYVWFLKETGSKKLA